MVNRRNGQFYNLDVLLFVMATYIVDLTVLSFAYYQVDCLAMVFYIQPVAYVCTVSVYRQAFSLEDILDDQRDQLFRKMIRTVVVRAARNGNRHLIRVAISHDNQVGAGFRSAVRAVRT